MPAFFAAAYVVALAYADNIFVSIIVRLVAAFAFRQLVNVIQNPIDFCGDVAARQDII